MANGLNGLLYYLDTHHILKLSVSLYYVPTFIFGVGGSYYNFYMTINSYVGDLSNLEPQTRVRRYTLAEASVVLGVITSYYAGYLITQYLGDFYIFVVTFTTSAMALLYGVVRIQNIKPEKLSQENEDDKSVKVNSHTSQNLD